MKTNVFKRYTAVIAACTLLLAGCSSTPASTTSAASASKASAKLTLILEDGSKVDYDLNVTEGASLRDALYEAKLIDEATYGAMTVDTIDGHTADVMNDGVTWLPVDEAGNQLPEEIKAESISFLDKIAVNDGDVIYLQYFVVPNFD